MLVDYSRVKNIFLVTGRSDLRKGIDGLGSIILHQFELDLFDNAIFLFCGTRKDRFKALYWDGDGFLLLYKRLDKGRLQWPREEAEVAQLTDQQLRWLLEGLAIHQPKALKAVEPGILS
jgi:transposase